VEKEARPVKIAPPGRGEIVVALDSHDDRAIALIQELQARACQMGCSYGITWPQGKYELHRIELPD
jgi:hypothetical protein